MPMRKLRSIADKQQCYRKHRRGKDLNQARRIERPNEQRQPRPVHTGSTHHVDSHYKVQSGQDR